MVQHLSHDILIMGAGLAGLRRIASLEPENVWVHEKRFDFRRKSE